MKKISFLFLLLICLCAGNVFTQDNSQKIDNECQNYGKMGFVGKTISLEFVSADLKELLAYYNQNFGCNFVTDKSVKIEQITVKIEDVPWNILLDSILRSKNLGIQRNGPILRIADIKTLETESPIPGCTLSFLPFDKMLLETEQIKLKHPLNQNSLDKENLPKILKRRLSRMGSLEFDEHSNTLIIKDVRENLDAIKNLIKILDQPPLYTELINLKRLQAGIAPGPCSFGGCNSNEVNQQYTGLVKVIAKLLSRIGTVESDSRSNSLIITDTREKLDEIIKQVKDWENSNLTLEEIIKDFESKNSRN